MTKFRNPSEKEICEYLINKNYIILEHNKIIQKEQLKIEIDIIAFREKNLTLHFIEVKNWNTKPYIHPIIKELKKRKYKLLLSSKIFIADVLDNINVYQHKYEYKKFLCHLKTISPWDLNVSFDLVWKKDSKIYHFRNIFRFT